MNGVQGPMNERASDRELTPTAEIRSPLKSPGDRIGQFQIERELGHGGAGIVYLARDTKLDRLVAIKSLPPQAANDMTTQLRFQREAKALASLNHPNIAIIHEELEEADGLAYLVLEYVPGDTLGQRITQGPMTTKDALKIALEIGEAMATAHAKGIVHRDLKPDNIKITPEGRTKILDFGIAKMVRAGGSAAATLTELGYIIGTPGYMSPEQVRGEPADPRTDIWSFGCVLYEMLTGRCAYPGETASEALASILKTEPDWGALPHEAACVRGVLTKCLQKDPEHRYPSAMELCRDLQRCRDALPGAAPKAFDLKAILRLLRRPRIAAGMALVLLLVAAGAGRVVTRGLKADWARREALPRITQLIEQKQYRQAFLLAGQAHRFIPQDPVLQALWPDMSREISIITEPPGARIYYRDYADFDGHNEYVGKSPLEKVRHPLGIFRWEARKGGFETQACTAGVYPSYNTALTILLSPVGNNPGMVVVPVDGKEPFWVDAYEVSNEQFQAFVDGDGYTRRELWQHSFVDDVGREVPWEDAVRRFVDKTGRPGPGTWEWGTYPNDQGKYPVGGVSWYEAAAYAEFVGKDLCAVSVWENAAGVGLGTVLADRSNFAGAPAPVGHYKVVGPFGLYDAAGNAKEWCFNAIDDRGSQRYILGGSWADRPYMFVSRRDARPPMNRDPTNGFRCAKYGGGIEVLAEARPVELPTLQEAKIVAPLSQEELQIYRRTLYGYNPSGLEDSSFVVDDSSRHWRKEKIEFDAAYGGERVRAYLFVPKSGSPPYQPVVFAPGTGAQDADTSEKLADMELVELLVKSGRAVLYPVYKTTYERKAPPGAGGLERMQWFLKDSRKSVDYLEDRAKKRGDLVMDKLTYCGQSLGVIFGPLTLAVETRFRYAILVTGGFYYSYDWDPAMDPARFAPLVRIPVLMLNGRWDSIFPIKTSVEPMFEHLGTPAADKSLRLYDGGHDAYGLFFWQIQTDMREWLDKYLGPVE